MGEYREGERIPGWNGEAAKFDDYCEEARWYRAGVKAADSFYVWFAGNNFVVPPNQ